MATACQEKHGEIIFLEEVSDAFEKHHEFDGKILANNVKPNSKDIFTYAKGKQNLDEDWAILTDADDSEHTKGVIEILNQADINTFVNDPQTLLKCVTIVSEFLEMSSLKTVNPTLHSVMDTLLLPGIQNEDPAVRNQAVKALGLCCLLNRDVACQHLLLFMQISQVDQETIQVTALKAILDLLLVFGLDAFKVEGISNETTERIEEVSETPSKGSEESIVESQENQRATSNIMAIVAAHLDSESREVRTLAAEGIGKLLLLGHVYSPRLLSHLLLLWYNPATENDIQLRHFLGVFLPAFASAAQSSQECLEEAFMPTLRTLFDAPASSPLADVDEANLARFIIQLTNPSLISSESKNYGESSVHDRLAEQLCNEILRDRESFNVRVLAKSLTYLELSCNSYSTLKNLAVLTEKITEKIKDRTSLKLIEKFQDTVLQLLAKAKENDPQASQESSFVEPTPPEIPDIVVEESQTSTTGIESDEAQIEESTSQEFFNDTIRTLKTRKKVEKSVVLRTGSKSVDISLTPRTACLTTTEGKIALKCSVMCRKLTKKSNNTFIVKELSGFSKEVIFNIKDVMLCIKAVL
ncbi:condensin complex subunit 3-like [Limulus polyphemus]|uniref:Condensin complex subunit 3-like n=1 Tax=Limulus polyphemus TaxID=6850 RepID=A0ABM1S2X8_LIMPO|nr:condensin complex subunit 3-like [Limulus polyphemus]